MNKRGDEMVEAAMVLPILILTVLSLILLIVYFFACINSQTQLHKQLIVEADRSQAIFKIINNKTETSSKIGGAVSLIMNRKIEGKIYVIDEGTLVRLGEFFHGE